MVFESLKQNIEREKEIIKEMAVILNQLKHIEIIYQNEKERDEAKKILLRTLSSLENQLKIINNSIVLLVKNISFFRELPSVSKKQTGIKNVVKIAYTNKKGDNIFVTLDKKDEERFIKELKINQESLERLKKKGKKKEKIPEIIEFKKSNPIISIANKIFLPLTLSLIKKGHFGNLRKNLRKANLPYILNSYVSMSFFFSLLTFIFSLLFVIFAAIFFKLSFINMMKYLTISFVSPLFTFSLFYAYPAVESKDMETKINQEIPFITLQMAAIASSKIEPTKIFQIIAFGKEYPYTKKEIIKIINQTNIYGYDLVTALKNVARETPSKKLSELLNGLATTISQGGDLVEFLNKRAETLFFEYKIERERYTREAETTMDIYISLVVAAPMIMSLILVLMNIGIMGNAMPIQTLTTLMILGIAVINIIFLAFLNVRQPMY